MGIGLSSGQAQTSPGARNRRGRSPPAFGRGQRGGRLIRFHLKGAGRSQAVAPPLAVLLPRPVVAALVEPFGSHSGQDGSPRRFGSPSPPKLRRMAASPASSLQHQTVVRAPVGTWPRTSLIVWHATRRRLYSPLRARRRTNVPDPRASSPIQKRTPPRNSRSRISGVVSVCPGSSVSRTAD